MKKSLILFFTFLLCDSCIDRLDILAPNASSQLVVDGYITDAPGPYTIKLSRTRKVADFSPFATVSAKKVTIFDNAGNSEALTEIRAGVYQTSPTGIRGVIGREYFIRIETRDDKIYESIPEKINPPGSVDSVYYEFEQYKTEQGNDKYQFRIFMDSKGERDGENLFLWKLTGTYKVITSPDLHILILQDRRIKRDPRPCSGAILDGSAGELLYVNPCECCECWVNQVDITPSVSDNYLVAQGQFKKVDMGIIPVEFWYFWDKTLVTVEQLSLSRSTFNYWKTIQDQKEGATSLFQPSTGKAVSNIFLKNGNEDVQGIFYASAISKKTVFLDATKIPLGVGVIPPPPGLPPRYFPKPDDPPELVALWYTPPFVVRESCLTAFRNSTTQQPPDWK
jgi:hypothetical protein